MPLYKGFSYPCSTENHTKMDRGIADKTIIDAINEIREKKEAKT